MRGRCLDLEAFQHHCCIGQFRRVLQKKNDQMKFGNFKNYHRARTPLGAYGAHSRNPGNGMHIFSIDGLSEYSRVVLVQDRGIEVLLHALLVSNPTPFSVA